MKNKGLVTITIYLIIMFVAGFGFGWTVYKDRYNELIQENDEYKWLYESCQTMFGDYQDKVKMGCYVNGGWNCEQ